MLWLATCTWLLGACTTLPGGPVAGQLPSGGHVMERLEARRQAVRSFSMQGEIQGQNRAGEINGEQRIMGRYPDRLRAEVMGPFGRPALLLMCDGVRMAVLAYGENKAYRGPASRANVARFLGLSLTPAEIYSLLTGSAPLLAGAQATVQASSQAGRAVLQLRDNARLEQGIIFSLDDYTVFESWVSDRGQGNSLNAKFEALTSQAQGRFPKRIHLADQEGRALTLDGDLLRINPTLDDQLFEPNLPPGMEVQELP
jgi:outer membrane lipoprotein-sorting protein